MKNSFEILKKFDTVYVSRTMNIKEFHDSSHYRSLIVELQSAKKEGFICDIVFLDHDLRITMNVSTPDSKVSEVAEHISNKYRIFAEARLSSKTIMIYDVYSLDPKV